jgi:hypothetical protein
VARLLLLLAAVTAAYFLVRWFVRTPPRTVIQVLKRGGLWGAIALVVVLAATGRLNWVFALAAAAVPLVQRLLTLVQLAPTLKRLLGMLQGSGASAGPGGPGTSTVTTRFLRMALDHATGDLTGIVTDGPYQGRALASLALAELLQLLEHYRAEDTQSAALLEAYLDRIHGPAWRATGDSGGPEGTAGSPAGSQMTREQAREILGVAADATPEDVRAAHRRLMQKMHPDRGGSNYLASLVNRAKDVLLGK